MEESDTMAVGARARRPVDQLQAARLARTQRGLEVGNAVGDVVQTGTPLLEEAAHGGVGTERLEQLEPAVPDSDETELHALRFDALATGTPSARRGFEGWEGVIDRRDRDRDVIQGETPQGSVRSAGVIVQVGLGQEIALNWWRKLWLMRARDNGCLV
jgi:hypothetical protein